ncbi:unnamed protein product [Amoebophrya sp. A25]|nr:unnamed protein product [Amoebophrya sp. A25]|eukprot:GSA25T00025883001.1
MDEHGCDSTLCIFDVVRNALGLEMQDSSASSACTERAKPCFSAPSVASSPTTSCGADCDQDHDAMKKKDGSTTTPSNVREKESPAVRDDGKACSFTVVFEQRRALGAYYHMIIRKDRMMRGIFLPRD